MYHTQEKRDVRLQKPVLCIEEDAWLGKGYYFWVDIFDAKRWGTKFKTKTGSYEIYKCNIDCEDVLDTVFNETHYFWWLEQIEMAAKEIKKKGSKGRRPTLKQINDYFKKSSEWSAITGILFQDVPESYDYSIIEPIKMKNGKTRIFTYKKRIQLALYNIEKLENFKLDSTNNCK